MPNIVDFDTITNVKEVRVKADGWRWPLSVEYGLALKYNVPSIFWRVKGTQHTFVIPIMRMQFLSKGDYEAHFKEALEGFRKDYLEWREGDFSEAEWQREYRDQYGGFIVAEDKESKRKEDKI